MNKRKIVGKLLISTLVLSTMVTGRYVVKATNTYENSTSINKSSCIYTKSDDNSVSDEFSKLKLKECSSSKGTYSAYYGGEVSDYSFIYVKNNNDNKDAIKIETSGACRELYWLSDRYILTSVQHLGLVLYDMNELDTPKNLYKSNPDFTEDQVPVKVKKASEGTIEFTDEWKNKEEIRYKFVNDTFAIDNSPKKIKEMSYDLNGDNIAEKISLYYSNTGICTIKVNNVSKNIKLESYLGEEYLKINAIGLNKKEKVKELQFISSIENGYKQIVIFKFDGKNLSTLYDFNIDSLITGMSFDGLGNIKTSCIKQSLYTLECTENYKYDGRAIKYIKTKYYKLNTPTTVILPIKVQKSQSNKTEPFKLYKGEKVKIVLTDGKGWFKLINSKGKEGWLYYDKKTWKVQGKARWEVFKNLPVAC